MKKTIIILFAFLLLIPNYAISKENEEDAIIGFWHTKNEKSKVKVYKKNGKFYGRIVWLKIPNYEDGTAKIDKHNPDESKTKKPLIGLLILRDFVYDEDNEWDDGEIYNPEDGKTYSCVMTLSEDGNTLDVRGYIGLSLFGKTTVWKRTKE